MATVFEFQTDLLEPLQEFQGILRKCERVSKVIVIFQELASFKQVFKDCKRVLKMFKSFEDTQKVMIKPWRVLIESERARKSI